MAADVIEVGGVSNVDEPAGGKAQIMKRSLDRECALRRTDAQDSRW